MMFGVEDQKLIDGLEAIRKRLCCYGPDAVTCDCKYGASFKGEQTGCPEIRQAIMLLCGEFQKVIVFEQRQEKSAVNTLRKIRSALAAADSADPS